MHLEDWSVTSLARFATEPENAHAHIVYRLKVPVCTSDMAHLEPMKYLAAIESAMTEKLKADRGFAGLLTKNPLHGHWQTEIWTEHEYTLDELADYLDFKNCLLHTVLVNFFNQRSAA